MKKISRWPLGWVPIQLALAMLLCIKVAMACTCVILISSFDKYAVGLPYHGQCHSTSYDMECYAWCGIATPDNPSTSSGDCKTRDEYIVGTSDPTKCKCNRKEAGGIWFCQSSTMYKRCDNGDGCDGNSQDDEISSKDCQANDGSPSNDCHGGELEVKTISLGGDISRSTNITEEMGILIEQNNGEDTCEFGGLGKLSLQNVGTDPTSVICDLREVQYTTGGDGTPRNQVELLGPIHNDPINNRISMEMYDQGSGKFNWKIKVNMNIPDCYSSINDAPYLQVFCHWQMPDAWTYWRTYTNMFRLRVTGTPSCAPSPAYVTNNGRLDSYIGNNNPQGWVTGFASALTLNQDSNGCGNSALTCTVYLAGSSCGGTVEDTNKVTCIMTNLDPTDPWKLEVSINSDVVISQNYDFRITFNEACNNNAHDYCTGNVATNPSYFSVVNTFGCQFITMPAPTRWWLKQQAGTFNLGTLEHWFKDNAVPLDCNIISVPSSQLRSVTGGSSAGLLAGDFTPQHQCSLEDAYYRDYTVDINGVQQTTVDHEIVVTAQDLCNENQLTVALTDPLYNGETLGYGNFIVNLDVTKDTSCDSRIRDVQLMQAGSTTVACNNFVIVHTKVGYLWDQTGHGIDSLTIQPLDTVNTFTEACDIVITPWYATTTQSIAKTYNDYNITVPVTLNIWCVHGYYPGVDPLKDGIHYLMKTGSFATVKMKGNVLRTGCDFETYSFVQTGGTLTTSAWIHPDPVTSGGRDENVQINLSAPGTLIFQVFPLIESSSEAQGIPVGNETYFTVEIHAETCFGSGLGSIDLFWVEEPTNTADTTNQYIDYTNGTVSQNHAIGSGCKMDKCAFYSESTCTDIPSQPINVFDCKTSGGGPDPLYELKIDFYKSLMVPDPFYIKMWADTKVFGIVDTVHNEHCLPARITWNCSLYMMDLTGHADQFFQAGGASTIFDPVTYTKWTTYTRVPPDDYCSTTCRFMYDADNTPVPIVTPSVNGSESMTVDTTSGFDIDGYTECTTQQGWAPVTRRSNTFHISACEAWPAQTATTDIKYTATFQGDTTKETHPGFTFNYGATGCSVDSCRVVSADDPCDASATVVPGLDCRILITDTTLKTISTEIDVTQGLRAYLDTYNLTTQLYDSTGSFHVCSQNQSIYHGVQLFIADLTVPPDTLITDYITFVGETFYLQPNNGADFVHIVDANYFCPMVKCRFRRLDAVPIVPMIINYLLNSQVLPVDTSTSKLMTGNVFCRTQNTTTDKPYPRYKTRFSNDFNIKIYDIPVCDSTTPILQLFMTGNTETAAGPVFTYSGFIDFTPACRVVNTNTCDGSDIATAVTCTATLNQTTKNITTSLDYNADTNHGSNIYFIELSHSPTPTRYVCSPQQLIVVDCQPVMKNRLANLITDYYFDIGGTDVALDPNNAAVRWHVTSYPTHCQVTCEWTPTTASISGSEILNNYTLSLDTTSSLNLTGEVECTHSNSLTANVTKSSNPFNIVVCSVPVAQPTTSIIYVPVDGSITKRLAPTGFPKFAITTDTCVYALKECKVLATCGDPGSEILDLTCTISDNGDVTIEYEEGGLWVNGVYAWIYDNYTGTPRYSSCSDLQHISYDCGDYGSNLDTNEDIVNYQFPIGGGTVPMMPNNPSNNWINNTLPSYCIFTCYFFTGSIDPNVANTTLGGLPMNVVNTLPLDITGIAKCETTSGLNDHTFISNQFNIYMCASPSPSTAPDIWYAPLSGSQLNHPQDYDIGMAGAEFTYVAGSCQADTCVVIKDSTTCDLNAITMNSIKPSGTTCSITDDTASDKYTTSIDLAKKYLFNDLNLDFIIMIYQSSSSSGFSCSPAHTVKHDCTQYIKNLNDTLSTIADIADYIYEVDASLISDTSFIPNNAEFVWVDNIDLRMCPMHCEFLHTANDSASTEIYYGSTSSSPKHRTWLLINKAVSLQQTGYVKCITVTNQSVEVIAFSNSFTVTVCNQPVPNTPPVINYEPFFNDMTKHSMAGPTFTFSGIICPKPNCRVLKSSTAPNCDGGDAESTDVDCTTTINGAQLETTLDITKGRSYWNDSDDYYIEIGSSDGIDSICSDKVFMVYDCDAYMTDLASSAFSGDPIIDQTLGIMAGLQNLDPNNAAVEWMENTKPNFCPTVCNFVAANSSLVTWITGSTVGSTTLQVDQSVPQLPVTGHVECTYTNSSGGSTVSKVSNDFTVDICQVATPGTSPSISYEPLFSVFTPVQVAGPNFTYTQNPCSIDSCVVVDNAGCDNSGIVADATCTFTDIGTQIETTILYQPGKTYDKLFVHLFKSGTPISNSICSSQVPIVYDCALYLNNVTEDIPDYFFLTSNVTGQVLPPNNTKAEWIENLKPNFCPINCQFFDSLSNSEQPFLSESGVGLIDLPFNMTDAWKIKGYVRCINEHPITGFKIRKYSNEFTIEIKPPYNHPPEFEPPGDLQLYVNQTETIQFGVPTDNDTQDIPYFHTVTIEPAPAGGFISFVNVTNNETITIDPLFDEANAGQYVVTITVDDSRGQQITESFKITVLKMPVEIVFEVIPEEVNGTEEAVEEETEPGPGPGEENGEEEQLKDQAAPQPKEEEEKPLISVSKFVPIEEPEEDVKAFVPIKEDFVPPPVRLRISEINRNGLCMIMFNQPLIRPIFVREIIKKAQDEADKDSEGRLLEESEVQTPEKLTSLDQIDVNRDVIQAFLQLVEEVNEEEITTNYQFDVTIVEWTNDWMKVQLNFTKPELISANVKYDSIYFKIQNPWMFTSQYGIKPKSELDKTVMPYKIPPQLPSGFDEVSMKEMAQKAMGFMVGVQLVLAFCIKSAIERMWQLFYFLQMVCALQILSTRLPVNAEIFFDNMKMIIFFEILQPDKFLPAIGIKMSMDEILGLNKQELAQGSEEDIDNLVNADSEAGDEDANSLKKLRFYLLIGGFGMAVLCLAMIVTACIKKLREKVWNLLKEVITGFIWNNTIKMLFISYLPQAITIVTAFALTLSIGDFSSMNFIANAAQLAVFILFPTCWFMLLKHKKYEIKGNKKIADRWGQLTYEVRLPYADNYQKDKKMKLPWHGMHDTSVYMYPFFLFRRLIWCFLPVLIKDMPGSQILAAFCILLPYQVWVCNVKPLETRQTRILVFNEFHLLMLLYVEMYLALKPEFEKAWIAGFAIIAIPVWVILVNVLYIIDELVLNKKLAKQAASLERLLKKFDRQEKRKGKNIPGLQRQNLMIGEELDLSNDTDHEEVARLEKIEKEEADRKEEERLKAQKAKKLVDDAKRRAEAEMKRKRKAAEVNILKVEPKDRLDEILEEIGNLKKPVSASEKKKDKGPTQYHFYKYSQPEAKEEMTNKEEITPTTNHVLRTNKQTGPLSLSQVSAMKQKDPVLKKQDTSNRLTMEIAEFRRQTKLNKAPQITTAEGQELFIVNFPLDPGHFDILPCKYAYTPAMREAHKNLMKDIERDMELCTDEKKLRNYQHELAYRKKCVQKQKDINKKLWDKVHRVKDSWKFSHVNKKLMEETGCSEDSIEYQLALTIECIVLFEKAHIRNAQKEEERKAKELKEKRKQEKEKERKKKKKEKEAKSKSKSKKDE